MTQLFKDRFALFDLLCADGHEAWVETLDAGCCGPNAVATHGDLAKWQQALADLPPANDVTLDAAANAVTLRGSFSDPAAQSGFHELLRVFRPWRKGPFELFGIAIDTEWRSDWKWDRLRDHVEFRNRRVLDVGCGNGYYGWKMLDAGARYVAGLDPFPLYALQHQVLRAYLPDLPVFVLPFGDTVIPQRLQAFDVAVSMGVLYHRSSPIDHLQKLYGALVPGGTLLLETLVVTDDGRDLLVPEGRYAKMRNVWFIPSVTMLERWLRRVGFRSINVIDVTRTTPAEQRRTEWMTFESLAEFLDPGNPARTIEGYPAPVRAMVTAVK